MCASYRPCLFDVEGIDETLGFVIPCELMVDMSLWKVGLVNSWNEWDRLEEIIVGTASLAVIPPLEPAFEVRKLAMLFP